jgi:hypothetical protein
LRPKPPNAASAGLLLLCDLAIWHPALPVLLLRQRPTNGKETTDVNPKAPCFIYPFFSRQHLLAFIQISHHSRMERYKFELK